MHQRNADEHNNQGSGWWSKALDVPRRTRALEMHARFGRPKRTHARIYQSIRVDERGAIDGLDSRYGIIVS